MVFEVLFTIFKNRMNNHMKRLSINAQKLVKALAFMWLLIICTA